MIRIEKRLREVEDRLVYLASDQRIPESDRALLLPVLSSHLETVNRFKLMQLTPITGADK